jgi:hypothetical protein
VKNQRRKFKLKNHAFWEGKLNRNYRCNKMKNSDQTLDEKFMWKNDLTLENKASKKKNSTT